MYNHNLLCYVKCLTSLLPSLSHSHEPLPHHTSVYLVTNPSTHHDPRLMNPAALMINPTPWITNMNMNHMKKRELSFLGRGGGVGGRGRGRGEDGQQYARGRQTWATCKTDFKWNFQSRFSCRISLPCSLPPTVISYLPPPTC